MTNILEQAKDIRKIWSGFQGARVLITANNYRVFDHLEEQKPARKVAKELKTDIRATEILLDALTGLGLLKKKKSIYENADIASRFLVTGKTYYQGDIIKHIETLWDNWSGFDTVLRSGTPFHKSHNHQAFILGMHNLASLKAENVLKLMGLKGVKTALDLGGGPGTYSIEMAKKGIDVTLFDRPETIEIAKRLISKIPLNPPLTKGELKRSEPLAKVDSKTPTLKKGLACPAGMGEGGFEKHFKKKISFMQGDFLHDDIGKGYDLIFASQIIHSMSGKDNIHLLKKCRKALNIGGRVVVQEFLISNDLTQPSNSSLFSINMLVNTEGGRCYSPDEMKDWFLKTGFSNVRKKLVADGVLISATN